ncbi:hypothetical protein ACS0TY_022040 [Phlomoides rotata]
MSLAATSQIVRAKATTTRLTDIVLFILRSRSIAKVGGGFEQVRAFFPNPSQEHIFEEALKAVHRQIPFLVRTIGSSSNLLDIISNPPTGSEGLVTQAVHTLTDGAVPSQELISTIKRLYDTKLKVIIDFSLFISTYSGWSFYLVVDLCRIFDF